jgi:uncharacterized protein YdeI (YjbR/CyaY-like superfamily)
MSDTLETVRMENGAAWRRWLRQHHGTSPGVWLLFHKKSSGHQTLSYEEALEEALCVGWIDSIVRRLDDERYLQKFTPRREGSDWSLANRNRVRRLFKAGRLMPEGLALTGPWIHAPEEVQPPPEEESPEVPAVLAGALKAKARAEAAYAALPPGQRRLCVKWVMDAKREETRRKRAAEVARTLAAGKRLGLK